MLNWYNLQIPYSCLQKFVNTFSRVLEKFSTYILEEKSLLYLSICTQMAKTSYITSRKQLFISFDKFHFYLYNGIRLK